MKLMEKFKKYLTDSDWDKEFRAIGVTLVVWVALVLFASCSSSLNQYPNISAVAMITVTFLIIRIGIKNQSSDSFHKGYKTGYDAGYEKALDDENEERYERQHEDR